MEQIKQIALVIDEKRREAQQNFTVNEIPAVVAEVERTTVPSEETLTRMFPDLGDDFEISVWIQTLSAITPEAVADLRAATRTKLAERLAASTRLRAERLQFTQLDFGPAVEEEEVGNGTRRRRDADNSTNRFHVYTS